MDEENVFADADIWECNMKKQLKQEECQGVEEPGSF